MKTERKREGGREGGTKKKKKEGRKVSCLFVDKSLAIPKSCSIFL